MAAVAQQNRKISSMKKYLNKIKKKVTRRKVGKPRAPRRRKTGRGARTLLVSPVMHRFINCVTDPFGCRDGACVPDSYVGHSLVLKDFIPNSLLTAIGSTEQTVSSISAIVMWIVPGVASTQYYSTSSNMDNSDDDYSYYHIGIACLTSDGVIASIADGVNYYPAYGPKNEITIFSEDTSNSLAQSGRIVSFGLKVWPQIETITTSDTLAISTIMAGTIQYSSLITDYLDFGGTQQQILAGLESNGNFKTYPNAEGVTVRLNTLQPDMISMKSQTNWHDSSKYYIDEYHVPLIYIGFTQSISGSAGAIDGASYFQTPLYIESIVWLEAALQTPTPILQTTSPIDHNYLNIVTSMLAAGPAVFPVVTRGHSFKSFSQNMAKFSRHVAAFLDNSSHLATSVSRGLRVFSANLSSE